MKANVVSELIAAKADVDRKDKVRQQLEALSFANIFELFLTPLLTGRDDTAQCSYGTRRSWRDPSPLARRRRLHFHRQGSNCSCLHLGSTCTSLTRFLNVCLPSAADHKYNETNGAKESAHSVAYSSCEGGRHWQGIYAVRGPPRARKRGQLKIQKGSQI